MGRLLPNFDVENPEEIAEAYFEWLYSLVGSQTRMYGCYKNLMLCFYSHDFYWSIPMDVNRESDGLDLRSRFCDLYGLDIGEIEVVFDKPCSVLEMMVALARRIEDTLMWDPIKGDQTYRWFWDMVHNLGLVDENGGEDGVFSDKNWNHNCEVLAHHLIGKFLNRDYEPNGQGGLFPLKDTSFPDQTGIEIWYEMQYYYSEKLSFD